MNFKRMAMIMSLAMAVGTVMAIDGKTEMVTSRTADTSRVVDIDEIVVIPQSKEILSLRRQPLGSSMFSSADLRRMVMRSLSDLSSYVPSFSMPDYGSRYTSSIYIRGIGSRLNSPAVGVYSDGLPLVSKSAYNRHSYGLSRVDVLRGPQGTLYGINSEGGLIRTYHLDPLGFQGTRVRAGMGTHFIRQIEFGHYAKLNEKTGFSLSGFYNGHNGFFDNVTTGEHADKMNEAGGRVRLAYMPSSDFRLDYIADYQYVRQNGFPYGLWDVESDAVGGPSANRQPNYRRNMLLSGISLTRRWNEVTFSSATSYQYLKDYMLMDIDYLPADYLLMEERQHQNALTHEMVFMGTVPIGNENTGMAWRWSIGSFTSYQWNKTEAPVSFMSEMNNMIGNTVQNAMYEAMVRSMMSQFMGNGMAEEQARLMAMRVIDGRGGVTMRVNVEPIPGDFHLPEFNQGLFHETSLDVGRRLTLTVGLRYDYSGVRLDYRTQARMDSEATVMGSKATARLSSSLVNSCRDSYSQLLPKFGVSWKTDDHGSNLYAVISKGYRSGGFNYQMFSDILQAELVSNASQRGDYDVPHAAGDYERIRNTISYAPETTWNYEVGGHFNLFGNTVQMDMAVYLMNIYDQQLSVMAGNYGFGRMMVNAGRSRSMGGEVSLRGSHLDNRLVWSASYALTHSVFRDYKDVVTVDGVSSPVDYRHLRVPFIPYHTLSVSADYRVDMRDSWLQAIVLGINATAQGSIYWDEANAYRQKLYAVAGGHVDAKFGNITVSVWGRNLTNTCYNNFAVESSATGDDLVFAQRGAPFHMGVDLRLSF